MEKSPEELMFASKIKSILDKLLPGKNIYIKAKKYIWRIGNTCSISKHFEVGDKDHFTNYENGKENWKDGCVMWCI